MEQFNEGNILPIIVNIKLLYEDSVIPVKATEGSAGYDCVAHRVVDNQDIHLYECYLGFALEIPSGYVGLLFPRSSSANRGNLMANCVGVIDSDYRGELCAKFRYGQLPYNIGERCCQLIFVRLPKIELSVVNELSDTVRGANGYGSTGQDAIVN